MACSGVMRVSFCAWGAAARSCLRARRGVLGEGIYRQGGYDQRRRERIARLLCTISFILRPFPGFALRRTALALLQGYNFIVVSAMSQPQPHPVADPLTAPGASQEGGPYPVSTVLLAALQAQEASLDTARYCGTLTPRVFDGLPGEMDSLLHSAGVSDLGWRGKIQVTGSDRLRWLNGMVSNTVQSLPEGEGNYSFLLSVQGRIQGDCYVYRRSGDLLLDTGFDQIPALMRHLDHFIIMDDVELADVSHQWTALSLAGPGAPGCWQRWASRRPLPAWKMRA